MTPDQVSNLLDILSNVTIAGALGIALWAFYTDRVVSGTRWRASEEARQKAEAQRDEAITGWREQAEATKQVTQVGTETLQYLRDELPRRRAAPRDR